MKFQATTIPKTSKVKTLFEVDQECHDKCNHRKKGLLVRSARVGENQQDAAGYMPGRRWDDIDRPTCVPTNTGSNGIRCHEDGLRSESTQQSRARQALERTTSHWKEKKDPEDSSDHSTIEHFQLARGSVTRYTNFRKRLTALISPRLFPTMMMN